MRKTAIIFLIALLLFNLVGYKLVFYYAQQQSDRQMATSLDNGVYDEADLITIKVPLSNPYQIDRPDFERVDGEINVNGIIYKYVKRKITNGQLILLCLPDRNKMRLQKTKDSFFRTSNDVVQHGAKNSSSSKNIGLKNVENDYDRSFNEYIVPPCLIQHSFVGSYQNCGLISAPHVSPEQPPDMV